MPVLPANSKRLFVLLAFFASLRFCGELSAADWPEFRGPFGNGHVSADKKPVGLPLKWSETENVKWKIEIPHKGWSTPVVLGNQVWLTTATIDGKDFFVICVDAESGKVLFNEKLFHSDKPEPLSNPVNCYGSASPVIEAGRVYVNFGCYGTACLDTGNFKEVWRREDLPCRHYRGPGSSLLMYEDLVVLTMDGVDQQYVVALDKKTGQNVWKTERSTKWDDLDKNGQPEREGDFRKAFSTPIIAEVPAGRDAGATKPLLISAGSKAVFAYEPKSGKEIWRLSSGDYSAAARPVYGKGLVFAMTGQGRAGLQAIKADGSGDISGTNVAWKLDRGGSKTTSPILIDDLLYWVTDDGGATCVEAETGREVWKSRIGGSFCASPIYADDRIYFSSIQGKTTVVKAGRTYEMLAANVLDGQFMASPAVSGKALFLRTKTHMYRIEAR
ncbi:MAG TPA: PQQ-binding-like beta-propeller repeat protein [Planctomycetota bacterium]|jgi:outer membrane protein assembly factor BamB